MSLSSKIDDKKQALDLWNNHKKELAENCLKKIEDHTLCGNDDNAYPTQGKIYFTELGENIGYEINRPHPALVISKNQYNKTGTVIIAPLSSGKIRNHKHILGCQYILRARNYNYLAKDSVVKLDQMRCISVNRLINYRGKISDEDMKAIKRRIKKTFDID
ncbi:type II toxin-antitoxin system PemK/MazF family toxin [Limosilactobacillus vaginalis]|uniref:type II toxin-antitoxin system PemK/MazF family toxin n=1 Tax=Limosilactobacillus vaginalis TaxID=1633 RepID=UPI0021B5CBD0|nr:type II toxin-antitoxin system PemK/MazF family toxin [Limosilactobacillus vaginalis]UXC68620.1 type II toxin-antitoxin system PemK/MazF family toxin [Limosilactobacillus vaginalis]